MQLAILIIIAVLVVLVLLNTSIIIFNLHEKMHFRKIILSKGNTDEPIDNISINNYAETDSNQEAEGTLCDMEISNKSEEAAEKNITCDQIKRINSKVSKKTEAEQEQENEIKITAECVQCDSAGTSISVKKDCNKSEEDQTPTNGEAKQVVSVKGNEAQQSVGSLDKRGDKDNQNKIIADLKKQLKGSKNYIDYLENKNACLSNEKKDIVKERNDYKEKAVKWEKDNKKLLEEKKSYEQKFKNITRNNVDLQKTLKSSADDVRKQYIDAIARIKELEINIENIENENNTLQTKCSELEKNLVESNNEVEENKIKIEEIKKEKIKILQELDDSMVSKNEFETLRINEQKYKSEAENYRKMIEDGNNISSAIEYKMNQYYLSASKFNDVLTICQKYEDSENIDVLQKTIARIEEIADSVTDTLKELRGEY